MNDKCTWYKSYTISRTLKNQDLSRSRQGINLAIQGTILVKPVDEIKIFLSICVISIVKENNATTNSMLDNQYEIST